MKYISSSVDILGELCLATGKYGLYFSFSYADWDEIVKAAPYLDKNYQALGEGNGYFLCDTLEEVSKLFWLTVGEDGKTETNPYNGPARVFATTYGPDGKGIHVNT